MHTHTALLVIDAQVGLFEGAHRREEIVARIADLIGKARVAATPVIYIQHDDHTPGGLLEVQSPGWQIHPGIAPSETDIVVHKQTSDSFYETSLQRELDAFDVGRLVITGMRTEYCVDTTARRAVSLGYDVTLAADAHTTRANAVLTAEQIIAHHNATLDDFGNDDHVVVTAAARTIEFQDERRPGQLPA